MSKETKRIMWLFFGFVMLVFIVLLIFGCSDAKAQDDPSGYTANYGFRLYEESDYPTADSINENWIDIDLSLKDRQNTIDSLWTMLGVSHSIPSGTLKPNIVSPGVTTDGFFWKYFYKYTDPSEDVYWRLNTDLTQFDDDTLYIKDGVFGKITETNTWTGTNTFENMNRVTFLQDAWIGDNDTGGIYFEVPDNKKFKFNINTIEYFRIGKGLTYSKSPMLIGDYVETDSIIANDDVVVNGRLLMTVGDTVANTGQLEISYNGNTIYVSGGGTLDGVKGSGGYGWEPGALVVLRFVSNTTVSNGIVLGESDPIYLDGGKNWSASAGDAIVLQFTGGSWEEIARKRTKATTLEYTGTSNGESGAVLDLDQNGNTFTVTDNAVIDGIANDGWSEPDGITLYFTGSGTLRSERTGSHIHFVLPAGSDISYSAGDIIKLKYIAGAFRLIVHSNY